MMSERQLISPSLFEVMSVGALQIYLRTLRRWREEDPAAEQELSTEVYRVDTLIEHKQAVRWVTGGDDD